jgi:hypothetical protein
MTLLFVEYISWFAFAGAAVLVGWVGADMFMSKRRKAAKPAPEPQDSGRGLAGPPEPMSSARQPEVKVEEPEIAEEPKVEAPEQKEIEPAEELLLPSSQAVEMTEEEKAPEAEKESAPDEPVEVEAEESSEEVVSGDIMVKRDPSVRVFDAVVAPSERKVLTNED